MMIMMIISKEDYIRRRVDRCWHRLKLSGASGHVPTMNAGYHDGDDDNHHDHDHEI